MSTTATVPMVLSLAEAERAERAAAQWLAWCERTDDGSPLATARLEAATARHARAEAALGSALALAS